MVAIHHEFEVFCKYGVWAPQVFFQMTLHVRSCKANTTTNEQEQDGSAEKLAKKPKAKQLKALQGENKEDYGEFIDMNLPSDNFDMTMSSAIIDFNNMSVDAGCMLGNNNNGKLLNKH